MSARVREGARASARERVRGSECEGSESEGASARGESAWSECKSMSAELVLE